MLDGAGGMSMLDFLQQDRHRGYLVEVSPTILNLQPIYIIQHPNGEPLIEMPSRRLATRTVPSMQLA